MLHTVATYGRLDYAFNNAGIEGFFKPLHEQSIEDFDNLMAINVRGLFLCMKYEIQQMLSQGSGVIVNNSSTAGLVAFPETSPYVASKHAVMGLTRSAALDYAKQGIRVNAVNPGGTTTEMLDRAFRQLGITVVDHLEAKGHLAFAPTIAGHGKGVNKNVNHANVRNRLLITL